MLVVLVLGGLVGVLCLVLISPTSTPAAANADDNFAEQEVTIPSDGVELHGSMLILNGHAEPVPGIVLIHGAGSHTRDAVRQHAEAFTELGVATLIYDKPQDGYSQFDRSYELLAQDALAAAGAVSKHPAVDADAVGLWGLSEGGWVGPLAATKSAEIAFIITVGASGVLRISFTNNPTRQPVVPEGRLNLGTWTAWRVAPRAGVP